MSKISELRHAPTRVTMRGVMRRISRASCMRVAVAGLLVACGGGTPAPVIQSAVARPATPELINGSDAYRRAGFLTATGEIPFVGSVRVIAGPDADNAHVVVAFSFPNRSLSFSRDGAQYRAAYDVTYEVRSGATVVQNRTTHSDVRVASFRETLRPEESVIVQQILTLPSGAFTLEVEARDAAATRRGTATTQIVVPHLAGGSFLAVAPVYQAVPRSERASALRIVVNPRATVVFGRDTSLQLYVESYGRGAPRRARVRVGTPANVFYDSEVDLSGSGDVHAAQVYLPVRSIGFGILEATVVPDGNAAAAVSIPVVVRLGEELALAPFDEMVDYLQFFADADQLRALRGAEAESRAKTWASLLRAGDTSVTGSRDALTDYLRRVQVANTEFREDAIAGWLTDRGKAFSAFGPPDEITDQAPNDGSRGRPLLVWDYRYPALHLVFTDRSTHGRWRLTASSQAAFDSVLNRVTSCRGCR
ncbi:MAG TPA: GWxTD domain-containing protein [Gemmatimonadaceae bacterium]